MSCPVRVTIHTKTGIIVLNYTYKDQVINIAYVYVYLVYYIYKGGYAAG